MPDDINPAVTTPDASHNDIEEIDDTSLESFGDLGILRLHHNSIRYIEEGVFDNKRF